MAILENTLYCQCGNFAPRYGISGNLRCGKCHLQIKPTGRTSKSKRHGSAMSLADIPTAYEYYQSGWTLRRIAAHYRVTYHDIRNAILYHYGTLERPYRYTCSGVARLLGLPSNALPRRWAEEGDLPVTPGKSHRTTAYADLWVTRADLMLFLLRRDKWMRWHPQRITDPALRAYATDLRSKVSWRWLQAHAEAVPILLVTRTSIEEWLREGLLPGVKEGGEWFIRSDHAETLAQKLRSYPKDWKALARQESIQYAA